MKNLLYRRGSNQYIKIVKRSENRILGLKKRTWISIIIILAIMMTTAYFGNQVVAHEPGKFISPLPADAYTYDSAPTPYLMPSPAPLPERQRNIQLIDWIFGADAEQAVKVFMCESGLRTDAINWNNADHFPDVGIAQIHTTSSSLFRLDEMENAVANLYQAKRLFDTRGFQPWDSSKSCWGK